MKKQRFLRKTEKLRKSFFLLGLVLALSATYVALTTESAHYFSIPERVTVAEDDNIVIQQTFRKIEKAQKIEKTELKKVNNLLAQSFTDQFISVDNWADVLESSDNFGMGEVPEVFEIAEQEIDWVVLDRKPVYLGCEKLKSEKDREKCFQQKLSNYIIDNFDNNAMGWGDTQKIYVNFVIDKEGNVTEVNAIRGDEKDREQLEKLIEELPQFLPAMYMGKYVGTSFTLPIVLRN